MMVGKPSGRNPHKSSARNLKFSIDSLGEAVELCETQCAVICFTEMLPLRKWSVSWESSNIFWIWMYISIHIIDYIGLCMYTSTCLYILLICMYIHIYIHYILYIYMYIYTCAWNTVACNTLNAWFPTKHGSHFHPKTACEMSFVLGFAALPHCANRRRCHCHTSSFKQMLSYHVHGHMNEYSFCRKASIISTDFCNPNPVTVRLKKNSKFEVRIASGKTS